ncbi:Poly(A)-specific ribonuclease PARN-like domain-containing protein 1 [Dufourea novaeangliae]|uniref:Poly(A)-specific ribonuclease PARN-like domain-containing protein 1 n=1 Tax=Dufourea novaeangliae TaxID=178035 RepID=A0A154PK67_DUFNO|nr:Poly(A)-specific ribonuclease PARN-like domain-containing protein 1 [Dufourea novaeangliae]
MYDVVESNIEELYPDIKDTIKNASFIAFDAEFSGIQSDEQMKYSLFDSLDDRYKILRKNIKSYVIVQCGIVAFKHVPDKNIYKAKSYNFYLLPRSVPFKNRQFLWQVSALEFLSTHNFDFNKFVNEGITYLDEIDEDLMTKHVKEGNLQRNLEYLSYEEEDDFKDCKNKVSEWISTYPNEISMVLKAASPILQYMMHKELRSSFKNIWTVYGHKSITVIRVSDDMRLVLENEQTDNLEEKLLNCCIGFSKVFKLLTSTRKPIIGHNVLLDLMFMHQQFYKPLPCSYREFKSTIHSLFPQIYDTKFLASQVKQVLDKEVNWKISSLSAIHQYFTSKQRKYSAFNSPQIMTENKSSDENAYHTAGWDAYYAGYIFVKMAHILCIKQYGEGLEYRAVTHSELMSSVKCFVNSINITRGNEVYSKLDGDDPLSTRPEWLHVKLNSPCINIKEVAKVFSSFGPIDVMPFARKRVLVAVGNHRRGGVVLSGGMLAWMIQRVFKKSVISN